MTQFSAKFVVQSHIGQNSIRDWTYLTFKNGCAPRIGCHSMAQPSCHHVHPMRFNQFADFIHFIFFYLNYITQLKLLRKLLRLQKYTTLNYSKFWSAYLNTFNSNKNLHTKHGKLNQTFALSQFY